MPPPENTASISMEIHPWICTGRFGLLVRKNAECWQDAPLERKMKKMLFYYFSA